MSTEEPVPDADAPADEPLVEKPLSGPFSKDAVEAAIEAAKPALMKMSVGSVMGYCSGYALKKVGKAMAVVVGLGFVGLQSAAYGGYITVNWMKVADDAIIKPLDTVRRVLVGILCWNFSFHLCNSSW